MDIFSEATNSKYINRYIERETYVELHITDLENIDNVILIDRDDVEKCQNYFWCCSLTGREGYKKPTIYAYVGKKQKLLLSRLLLEVKENQKVIFKNKDCLDFRKENLHIVNPKESLVRNDEDKETPTGITKHIERINNKVTGYLVHYFDENKNYTNKYFGIREYLTLDKALDEAIKFKLKVS